MTELNREFRGVTLRGGRTVRMDQQPSEERKRAIRAEQVKLARKALGLKPAGAPPNDQGAPAEAKER
jgi:hypothetical protein